MTQVQTRQLTKRFGKTVALDQVDLCIEPGELFFLLGPSGCGKSTLLRMVAGLLEPDAGSILFNGRDVTAMPTQRRNAVMCFQNYALWPHLTVKQNVEFGLKERKISGGERTKRLNEALESVRMSQYAQRKPNELSGGQQQRVALARAMAVRPDCLLLDEPLSNLDAKLRNEMRLEIRSLCKSAGFTTLYVTHDQKEALSVADRIAVLREGKLMQVGTPAQLYQQPNSSFMAEFIGQANLIQGRVLERDGEWLGIDTPIGQLVARGEAQLGHTVRLCLRPEQIYLDDASLAGKISDAAADPGWNRLSGECISSLFLGESSEHVVRVRHRELRVLATPPQLNVAENISLRFRPCDVRVLSE